jgi:zinc protease
MEITTGEVDGVRVISMPEGAVQGPLQAWLMFGVGRADETMPSAGISHLVEHLTLQPVGKVDYAYNGSVGFVSTSFKVVGTDVQVVDFFARVANHLSELPISRLSEEVRILEVEGAKRSRSQMTLDLASRFGAQGVGLVDWPEHGLNRLTPDEILQWSTQRYTAQNAAMWLSGPVPPSLSLAGLPQGDKSERPTARLFTKARTYVGAETDSISVSVLSHDSQWGIIPAMSTARERAFERLRRTEAVSYEVNFSRERLGGERALLFLHADSAEGAQASVLTGLVEIMNQLAEVGPTTAELEEMARRRQQHSDAPQRAMAYVHSWCERYLLGLETYSFEEMDQRNAEQTPETMKADLAASLPTMLVVGPEGLDVPDGLAPLSEWSEDRIDGDRYLPISQRQVGELTVGTSGVTWGLDEERFRTVHWQDAVACFTWDNGVRGVMGSGGQVITVTPWHWEGGSGLTSIVDSNMDEHTRIRLGPGETQRLRDRNDPGSVVDVHWLATIVGAACRQQRVDLVVDTDGLLMLFDRPPKFQSGNRLETLRSEDREELLSTNSHNRWIPASDMTGGALTRTRLSRLNSLKATIVISTNAPEELKVHLVNDKQVDLAKKAFRRLLGPKFRI